MHRTFSALSVPNYRYYFAGQSVSLVGTWMQSTAQAWLVLKLTGSGVDLGAVIAAQTLPILILGPVGGTIADRFGKHRILFWTQAVAGLQALALGLAVLSGGARLWLVFVLAGVLGLINAVDNPTRQTFVGEMVPRDQLRNAVTLNTVIVNLARAVGPAIGGVLIATVGIGWCFVLNAASFIFVLGALRAMDLGRLTPAPLATGTGRSGLVEGFRYVASTPLLRNALLMMALVGTLSYEFQVSLPLLARYTFAGDAETYGVFTACVGIGAVVGGLIAASRRAARAEALARTALFFGVAIGLAAAAPSQLTEELALLLVGAGSVTFLSLGSTTLQLAAEPSMRGRVMSLWSVAFMGSTPIGGPIVGWIGGAAGARWALGIGAAAAVGAAAIGWCTLRPSRLAAVPGPADETVGAGDESVVAGDGSVVASDESVVAGPVVALEDVGRR
jgi:MFS family permease